jgi:hypothetical protein
VFTSYKRKKSEPFQKKQNSFSLRAEFGLSFGRNRQQPPVPVRPAMSPCPSISKDRRTANPWNRVRQWRANTALQIDAQQKQIEALTLGLQTVSAQLEASKSSPQLVLKSH